MLEHGAGKVGQHLPAMVRLHAEPPSFSLVPHAILLLASGCSAKALAHLFDALLAEIGDVHELRLAADKVADGLDTLALEAVVGTNAELELLDGVSSTPELPWTARCSPSLPSRSDPSAILVIVGAKMGELFKQQIGGLGDGTPRVMAPLVSTSRVSLSKSVR